MQFTIHTSSSRKNKFQRVWMKAIYLVLLHSKKKKIYPVLPVDGFKLSN